MTGEAGASSVRLRLERRDWLLGVKEELAALAPANTVVDRYADIDPDMFLDFNYAANRPAVLTGALAGWPALGWTARGLVERVGRAPVEFQGGRAASATFELDKLHHRRTLPFDEFVALIEDGQPNDAYLTAFNAGANAAALAPLHVDLGRIDAILDHRPGIAEAMLWIGGAGTFTPMHHDLTNNLLAQFVGRKRVILVPAGEAPKLPNSRHVFSDVADLLDPAARERVPALASVSYYDLILQPGEALFLPIGWWHQVTALDFSVSATYTNFRWRNDWHAGFPRD